MAKNLGKTIRDAREKKDMTREQLAKKLGITEKFLGVLEYGSRYHSISERIRSEINKILKTKISEKSLLDHNRRAKKNSLQYR